MQGDTEERTVILAGFYSAQLSSDPGIDGTSSPQSIHL